MFAQQGLSQECRRTLFRVPEGAGGRGGEVGPGGGLQGHSPSLLWPGQGQGAPQFGRPRPVRAALRVPCIASEG